MLSLVAVFATSCESWIDSDMNISPNSPSDVPMSLLLPSAEAGIAYSAGGELSRYSCMWMQQISGVTAHAQGYERYILLESDMDNLWKWYTYAGQLMDLKRMIDKSAEEGKESPHFSAVAKILTAYKLGVSTDVWNDIPYEDAFQGETTGQLTATYHTQERVYEIMNTMITEAMSELDAAESIYSPGSEDFIYRGDLSLWKKAAYALRARFAIHLSERNGDAAYTAALAAIGSAFTSNADDMEFDFGLAANEQAPLYQYEDQREGYIGGLGAKMIELLKNGGDTDPRLAVYAKPLADGSYIGHPAGAPLNLASMVGEYFAKADATVTLISYVELKFIEAEANFQLGNFGPAATAYNDAVKASLAKYGVTDATWEAANASETAGTISIDKIMTAKYIATFLQGETFTDWRRYNNIIGLSLAFKHNEDEIPRRFPYPTNERIYNSENMPEYGSITNHVWWDVN
ncbi:SusD/RagB family nutrient-binding outer membrane lipoprotein [Labilibaculum euxinus]